MKNIKLVLLVTCFSFFFIPARRFSNGRGGFRFLPEKSGENLSASLAPKSHENLDSLSLYRNKNTHKKRIVIFSSSGGGGHTSVSKGLTEYLGNTYEIIVLNALQTVLSPVDMLRTITFGKVSGEDIYNLCLRCGWSNAAGKYQSLGTSYMKMRHESLVALLLDFYKREKPDLIISVVPMMNAAFHEACQRANIPLLVITNDLDSSTYIQAMKPPYSKQFKYCIPFDDPDIWKKLEAAKLPKEQVVVSGFPLRPEFFAPKDKEKLKNKFKVPPGKPVVMVFMGGAGSQSSYRYVRCLARINKPMHIIVCLGRNERLKRNISKIMLPKGVTTSLIGYTDKIAQLMAISDILITKPGPNSVCEGLQSSVPMILDQTFGTIWWEQLNIDFMVKHGFAEPLTDVADLEKTLRRYFTSHDFTDRIKKRMESFQHVRFDETIKPLVESMFIDQKGIS